MPMITKFKEGDRVKVVDWKGHDFALWNGKTGTVVNGRVKIDDYSNYDLCASDNELELLTEEKKSMDMEKTVLNSLLSEIDSLEDLLCDIDLSKPENIHYFTIAIGRILSLKSLMKEIMKD